MQNPTLQAQTLPITGSIDTPRGPLVFEGGYPTSETVGQLYDQFDFQRAVQTYLWAIPLVSFASWQEAHETVFGQEDGDLVLMTSFRDRLGILTANATTPYVIGFLNLQRTGSLVIDYPKGQTAGGILDFWQRPVKQFWAMTLYDTETRQFIDNLHKIAGLDSRLDLLKNADGSVGLYFGPTAPPGKEKNWIPTVPDLGWFAYFRFYAPTEPYFDRTWSLPDIEKVN